MGVGPSAARAVTACAGVHLPSCLRSWACKGVLNSESLELWSLDPLAGEVVSVSYRDCNSEFTSGCPNPQEIGQDRPPAPSPPTCLLPKYGCPCIAAFQSHSTRKNAYPTRKSLHYHHNLYINDLMIWNLSSSRNRKNESNRFSVIHNLNLKEPFQMWRWPIYSLELSARGNLFKYKKLEGSN